MAASISAIDTSRFQYELKVLKDFGLLEKDVYTYNDIHTFRVIKIMHEGLKCYGNFPIKPRSLLDRRPKGIPRSFWEKGVEMNDDEWMASLVGISVECVKNAKEAEKAATAILKDRSLGTFSERDMLYRRYEANKCRSGNSFIEQRLTDVYGSFFCQDVVIKAREILTTTCWDRCDDFYTLMSQSCYKTYSTKEQKYDAFVFRWSLEIIANDLKYLHKNTEQISQSEQLEGLPELFRSKIPKDDVYSTLTTKEDGIIIEANKRRVEVKRAPKSNKCNIM